MTKATYTPEARQDLKEIALWIGRQERRPSVAVTVIHQIKAVCDELARHHSDGIATGESKPEFGQNYRIFSHSRWVIIFRPANHGIEVMRIVDGSRDYDRLFSRQA